VQWSPDRLVEYSQAIADSSPVLRLMAHALDYTSSHVPALFANYVLIDMYPRGCRIGPCVVKADSPDAPLIERLYELLVIRAPSDPLARAAVSRSQSPLITLDDLDRSAYERSELAEALRSELGIGPRLWLLMRVKARPVAAIILMRAASAADFDAGEKRFLHDSHSFLESVHAVAVRRAHADTNLQRLARDSGLSPREYQVARMALQGLGNVALAEELGISATAVRRHIRGICRKCGVQNRTELSELVWGPVPER
jgi:DNA-binding CsgD family transcriptional regulator